jgi:hypothetical protein
MGGMVQNKEFCEFCMNYVCSNCISKPKEGFMNLKQKLVSLVKNKMGLVESKESQNMRSSDAVKRALFFPKSVCTKYLASLLEFKYIKVH